MGNQKLKWTSDEERALLAGIEKHGAGRWKNILQDSQFAPFLILRSNIDLKDKWRNLSVGAGQGSRERSKGSRVKNNHADAENPAPDVPVLRIASSDVAVDDDLAKSSRDGNDAERYSGMIFEALSTVSYANGSDTGAILSFIEQKEELPLPPNFRRTVVTTLKRLVSQGKLEKVQNGYKIKSGTHLGSPTAMAGPKQKEVKPRHSQSNLSKSSPATPQQVAAKNAAYRIAEAENKSFFAAEILKEVERMEEIVEECEAVIQLAEDLCAQCSEGEIFSFA